MRKLLPALIAALLLGFGASASAASTPSAHTTDSIDGVGALFFPSVLGLLPTLHGPHYCSASVVHSTGGDLVVTAAHCVYGTGATIEFAPGFHDGIAPYGIWAVRRIYLASSWIRHQDAAHDVAFLQVAPRAGRQIEDVVGAAPLGDPVAGQLVTVDGYPAGSGGKPITCTNGLYLTNGYPSFDCAGYVDGTSGGPWLQDGHVVGVVGGLEQGGCSYTTTYSAPFTDETAALLQRAEAGGPGDLVPIGFFANAC